MTAIEPFSIHIQLPIIIRQAEQSDLRALEWYGQFAHFRALFRRSYREQLAGRRLLLVADSGGYVIGRLFIQFVGPNPQVADGYSRGYLYSFHVTELFRGYGIGTRLIESAETILVERGFEWATLAVAKNNLRALKLYRRRGYQLFGENHHVWRYTDHKGVRREIFEPSWMLEKHLTLSS